MNVVCIQATGEVDGLGDAVADSPAQRPVVCPARSAQLLESRQRVAGVQQQRIHQACHASCLFQTVVISHVDDLHQAGSGECRPQAAQFRMRYVVDQLDRRRATAPVLVDDALSIEPRGQQEGLCGPANPRSDGRDQ